jgi:predicted methyltransferase
MSRRYTNKLIEMLQDGMIEKDTVIMACLKYMSEAEVQDMVEHNGFELETEDNE